VTDRPNKAMITGQFASRRIVATVEPNRFALAVRLRMEIASRRAAIRCCDRRTENRA